MTYTRKNFIRSATAAVLGVGLFKPLSLIAETKEHDPTGYRRRFKTLDEQQDSGTLSDTNITCIGRWDKSDSQLYHSYWGGAYLKTLFTGKTVSIRLASDTMLVVSIDNEVPRGVNGKQGITELTERPLKEGTHSLQVGSAGQNFEVSIQGLVLDANAVTMSPKPLPHSRNRSGQNFYC